MEFDHEDKSELSISLFAGNFGCQANAENRAELDEKGKVEEVKIPWTKKWGRRRGFPESKDADCFQSLDSIMNPPFQQEVGDHVQRVLRTTVTAIPTGQFHHLHHERTIVQNKAFKS